MRFLFYLGHPAHFHLFRPTVHALKEQGYFVDLMCKAKDVLVDLLEASGWDYTNILPRGKGSQKWSLATDLLTRNARMAIHCLRHRPDLMAGTSPEIAQVGRLLRIPSFVLNEDDVDVVPLLAKAAFPFCTRVVSPEQTNLGRWKHKQISYPGYQKLAYLHPERFHPNRSKIEHLFGDQERFYLLRTVSLTAHHDVGVRGLTPELTRRVADLLAPHGNVWLSAEGEIPEDLAERRLPIAPADIHHAMAYASGLVGDSQSMTVESAVLGTPSVRFSDFVGRIAILEELEHRYGLTVGVPADDPGRLLAEVERLIHAEPVVFQDRRAAMLEERIDVSGFLIWLFGQYPDSLREINTNPTRAADFISIPRSL